MTEPGTYRCGICMGTGSMESSDSTDDRWWDCSLCNGTGRVPDRRQPDPGLQDAQRAARAAAASSGFMRSLQDARSGEAHELHEFVESLPPDKSVRLEQAERALSVPLRETILAVLRQMPADAAPEHLAVQIESQVQAWQARARRSGSD